jgi:hypothetical protein
MTTDDARPETQVLGNTNTAIVQSRVHHAERVYEVGTLIHDNLLLFLNTCVYNALDSVYLLESGPELMSRCACVPPNSFQKPRLRVIRTL